jgi:hypothetical protein
MSEKKPQPTTAPRNIIDPLHRETVALLFR